MRNYRARIKATFVIEVEAASKDEAERIIEGVIDSERSTIHILESDDPDWGDELTSTKIEILALVDGPDLVSTTSSRRRR